MASEALCHVARPLSGSEVSEALAMAANRGWTVIPWGNGRSYGDAALNESNLVLDMRRMNQIIDWDPQSGLVTVQPGVTLEKLWKHILRDGWWPAVVTGTMFTTIGGIVAANAHGKNNYKHGPIGDHVVAFTLVSPDGQTREVTRESHPEVFQAAIGGFGWLGVFTSITLQTKKVHSGQVEVLPLAEESLGSMFQAFRRLTDQPWDYVVGWIDAFPGGVKLGRGQIHAARYVEAGEDPDAVQTFTLERQELPLRILWVFPKRSLWRLMKPFSHRLGLRLINWARFTWMRLKGPEQHLQPHAQFNFLLDYVPDWKKIYTPGGLIQYQFFLPDDVAEDVFRRALEMCQGARLEPWLVVMKRHRADEFWLSHAVDGYSFACDFPVLAGRRGDLWTLTQRFNRLVSESGGRFYFAKDSVLDGQSAEAAWGDETLSRFFALKRRLDPDGLLQSNLLRRVFSERLADSGDGADDLAINDLIGEEEDVQTAVPAPHVAPPDDPSLVLEEGVPPVKADA